MRITATTVIADIFRQQQEHLNASGILAPGTRASAYGQEWLLTLVHDPEEVVQLAGDMLVHPFPVASLSEGITLLHELTAALADYPVISKITVRPLRQDANLLLVVGTRIIAGFKPGAGPAGGV